jgi:hypothetical protein
MEIWKPGGETQYHCQEESPQRQRPQVVMAVVKVRLVAVEGGREQAH